MSAEGETSPIDSWKGVAIKKMGRGDLEREFIALATAERDRLKNVAIKSRTDAALASFPTAPPIDPQTARCLRELRECIQQIESGETALRRFSDELVDAGHLQRNVHLSATFLPPKAKA